MSEAALQTSCVIVEIDKFACALEREQIEEWIWQAMQRDGCGIIVTNDMQVVEKYSSLFRKVEGHEIDEKVLGG